MTDLKPCPFCGSSNVVMQDRGVLFAGVQLRHAWCQNCGARTNSGNTAAATDVWNRRATDRDMDTNPADVAILGGDPTP